MTNEELVRASQALVEKSIIDTTALASAGKLNPEQADKFIDFVIDITGMTSNVRVVRFRPETMDIPKIGVGARVTLPAVEASATSIRRGVSTSKVTLQPKELITPFEITDTFIEINLEMDTVEDHVVMMMAKQFGNDVEEMCINGDTLGHARLENDLFDSGSTTQYVKDTFTELTDGWLRKADSGNIYDAGGADISSTIFSRMITEMPVKFRRIRNDLRFLVSSDHEQLYLEKLSSRATNIGDSALQGSVVKPFGVPLVSIPLLESEPIVVEHFTLAAAPDTITLRYAPIGTDVVVTPQTLSSTPIDPYTETTDYTVDRTAGTITSVDAAALDLGGDVKVTYHSRGQVMLTNFANLILGIGRDVRIEKDRDIYKRAHQYAITTKVDVQVEEVTAVVKGINIGVN